MAGTRPTTESAADPWQIGRAHEQATPSADRERRGAWYTPRSVVEGLARLAIDGKSPPAFVVDPTCGGGAFLLGVLDRLVAVGVPPADAVQRVGGMDLDQGAVGAARAALDVWCEAQGVDGSVRLHHGDALDGLPAGWPTPELIIGNPPFSTPLRGRQHPPTAAEFRAARADVLGPYADLAAVHLLAAVEACARHGRVCLIMPQSTLASRDCEGLMDLLLDQDPPSVVWAAEQNLFDANVRVWAGVFDLGSTSGTTTLASGSRPEVVARAPIGPLAELVAGALGAPAVDIGGAATIGANPVLGDISATAGFRDEYYALAEACREGDSDDSRPRLVTVGSLDPLRCHWGHRPTKFARQNWKHPVLGEEPIEGAPGRWVARQLRPKIVLPTQSKVLEPVVDRTGTLVPVTPVVSIHASAEDLDLLAAVLLAPPVSVWAYRRWFGTALSPKAIKMAAKDILSLPTPIDEGAWREAADLVSQADGATAAEAHVVARDVAVAMTSAYGAPSDVLTWWLDRLPSVTR